MDIQLFLILFVLVVFVFLYIRYREKIGQELLVAFFIAFAWTSYYEYTYDGFIGYYFGPINVFTLVFHTTGLVILRELYKHIRGSFWKKFSYSILLYWLFLGLIEAFGFHILGIQVTPSYPSLLGLGILHVPVFAQIYYVSIGPVYLLITNYLKVK